MKLLIGYDAIIADWVAERLSFMETGEDFGPCVAIGVVDERAENILAGVVYHNAQPRFRSMEVSMAADSPRWMSRAIVNSLLTYPFVNQGCVRLSAVTSRKAKRTMRLLHGLGFAREGIARCGFGPNKDAVLFSMLAKEWAASRWATGDRLAEAA